MKQSLTIQEAEALILRYYEGETTHTEEIRLREFLSQKDLPAQFEAERALFGYFEHERTQTEFTAQEFMQPENEIPEPKSEPERIPPKGSFLRMPVALRWSLAAAALLAGVLVIGNQMRVPDRNIAYVNGMPCTDSREIHELAIASIQEVGLGTDDVAGTVRNMDDEDPVKSQLQGFENNE